MFFYNENAGDEAGIMGSADGWNLQLRQTWEPGDTDHIASGDIGTRVTANTTSVVDHSTLSNAISFAGDKCLYVNYYHYPYDQQNMWANTPELVSTSQSTAVSIRALIRDINSYGHWAFVFRNHPDGTYAGGGPWYGNVGGNLYADALGNIQPMAPDNVWKWYRADLIPQFNNGVWVNDKLEYYIADAEENPNWNLVGEATQTAVAWDHPTYKYHMLRWHDHSQSGTNKVFWIDNLEFYTKEV